jgi:hypothetical protein
MDLSISSSSLFGFVFLRARVEWILFFWNVKTFMKASDQPASHILAMVVVVVR